ncbi:lactate dehydrogenase [Agrobacterium vitis]|uniref:site-specific DNA-methyltransferase (adenine-specific) n=1 Tax=Agrobacterium vitis TaxID=373 RepID=A0A368NXU4_AGRVI|nr:DNA methyltransferase [Agrobacterium vitis]KAA3514870.1 class I SAM-dependent DNA methyltransferase [Agrobacterium vitis]KAA3528333.1 class I SAM-dependent DNA methyltransferase [Agrobacterium vitis]MUZ97820.1 lactate dehydrogenase [Agrobacterium vitis]MVA31076.1 lactate dehydrogenase [Agrobacterium vitis]NOJ35635.1 class I SAM-dependent DNA methyltransferase [Agrobacterium vitis]
MNAVEIEEAISVLAELPFDAEEFPYAFLEAFGNKETTLKRLRKGDSNKSDLGGVLQTNNIHIATCKPGEVTHTLQALKASSATARAKARFVLATDGELFEAEDLTTDDAPISCTYADFPNHFGFFLPLAGITTVKQVRESSFDIRATSRLNRLYVELLKDNPEWGTAQRRHDMNHFMARLIFCFFAEDTEIFDSGAAFTSAIETMSAKDSSNTHEVISELFRAMNTKAEAHAAAGVPRWASRFPYVNGGLFSGTTDVPRFSRIARSYLLHIGSLDWKKINPDIFGSMIQAVADDDERGALGMHYTSVPNILKVLNPLFLDDLREKLEEAGDNGRMLLNLRKRMSKIRVFDPACGSGNFLVIAYKEMRAIEAEVNKRRDEADRRTEIPLTNFRGIELRDFPAEIARLALIIAEYQCDVLYRGQKEALRDFLPLDAQNWITCGNALRLDWLSICPPTGTGVKYHADDLFHTPLNQAQIDFENDGGETYICGNPPYVWTNDQTSEQKADIKELFSALTRSWKSLNYVSGWFLKLCDYSKYCPCDGAFVSINTVCQGQHAIFLWPIILKNECRIHFAHTDFKWQNLAQNNAGVTVVIVGLSRKSSGGARLFYEEGSRVRAIDCSVIGPYLVPNIDVLIDKRNDPLSVVDVMPRGNMPYEGGKLLLSMSERDAILRRSPECETFIRRASGSSEIIDGKPKYCLWIEDGQLSDAMAIPEIAARVEAVRTLRSQNSDETVKAMAATAHRFRENNAPRHHLIAMPAVSSEKRDYLPVDLLDDRFTITNRAYGIYDGDFFQFAILASKLHIVWVGTVCGRLERRYSYTNTLAWNTFPVPMLTEKNKADLTRCAEDILLAREAHFPATIADLYDPDAMPADLRAAHDRNDEVLERIYIGRRFKNDTERLEKLFELYTKMSAGAANGKKRKAGAA